MTISRFLTLSKINGIQKVRLINPTENNPPAWDQQPNPTFTQGTASNYSLANLVSDADSDPVDITLNTGSVSLPSGVTYNTTLDRLEYDGAGAVASTAGHIATADDGTDTTNSIAFNCIISEAASTIDFPRMLALAWGDGTRSNAWSQTAAHENTFNFAMHDVGVSGFINPNVHPQATVATGLSTIRGHNSDVIIFNYEIGWEVTQTGYDVQNYHPTLESYSITGTNGAPDGDGFARTPAGALLSTWPSTWMVNPTTYTGKVNDRYALEYVMEGRYNEYGQHYAEGGFDGIYWDIGRWFLRYEGKDDVDLDRDNATEDYAGFDATAHPNAQIVTATIAGVSRVNAAYQTEHGGVDDLPMMWNSISCFDWFDGAHAYVGPKILTAADQPVGWPVQDGGPHQQNWHRYMGYNDNGTDNAAGNDFQRGFKILTRYLAYLNAMPINNTKICAPEVIIDDSTLSASERWRIRRYLTAVQCVAGAYCTINTANAGREPILMDEWVAGDVLSMTGAQILAAKHWLGQPVDADPVYGSVYEDGVQAGILPGTSGTYGVYCRRFDNGLVVFNPKGNGTQSFTLPVAGLTRFTGAQDSSWNNGSAFTNDDVTMAEATAYFLEYA